MSKFHIFFSVTNVFAIYLDYFCILYFLCSFSTKILSPYDFWHWELLTIRNKNLCIWNFRHSATWTDRDSTCDHRDRFSHTELSDSCFWASVLFPHFTRENCQNSSLSADSVRVWASVTDTSKFNCYTWNDMLLLFLFRSPQSVIYHQSPYKVTH